VTVTLNGLTMGAVAAGASSISIQTTADASASPTLIASGQIGDKVTSPTFAVSSTDRVAGKASSVATISFTTSAGGSLAISSFITLIYPPGFFASSSTPVVQISGIGVTGFTAMPTNNQIVITTATQAIAASTAVTVTVTGLIMSGTPTAGGNVSIVTSADQTASPGVASGVIGGQVTNASFVIAASDRVAGKASAAATFSFTTTAGGALATGSSITLIYLSGFFASSTTPLGAVSFNGTSLTPIGPPTANFIVISISGTTLPASTTFVVTLMGLTMGFANEGSESGVILSTSADAIPSFAIASGCIGCPVTGVAFFVAAKDRFAAKANVSATFSFTTTAVGGLAAGSRITLAYIGLLRRQYVAIGCNQWDWIQWLCSCARRDFNRHHHWRS
jgi:hypothetical protein